MLLSGVSHNNEDGMDGRSRRCPGHNLNRGVLASKHHRVLVDLELRTGLHRRYG